jgi:aspartate carbamoyltransferase catalytic subunit
MMVFHSRPGVGELALEADGDPGAAYFKQGGYGMFFRAALLSSLLGMA